MTATITLADGRILDVDCRHYRAYRPDMYDPGQREYLEVLGVSENGLATFTSDAEDAEIAAALRNLIESNR
jgi:hypothetical protein